MPTVLRDGEYRLFFYASDCSEPRHVHVRAGADTAKFWLDPDVRLALNNGIRIHQLARAERLIRNRVEELRNEWDEFCAGNDVN